MGKCMVHRTSWVVEEKYSNWKWRIYEIAIHHCTNNNSYIYNSSTHIKKCVQCFRCRSSKKNIVWFFSVQTAKSFFVLTFTLPLMSCHVISSLHSPHLVDYFFTTKKKIISFFLCRSWFFTPKNHLAINLKRNITPCVCRCTVYIVKSNA